MTAPVPTRNTKEVVADILMTRTSRNGSVLVLEGDDDIKFWKNRPIEPACEWIHAGGKATVENAVVQCDSLKQTGVLGVVDDDYDSLFGLPLKSANLIRLEARDLETLLLSSPALERVLAERGDLTKIADFERVHKITVRDALVDRALIFGRLRYLNAARKWGVKFHSPHAYADNQSWTFDHASLLRDFSAAVAGLTLETIEEELAKMPVAFSPWQILHGKDTIDVLAAGLKNVLGNGVNEKHLPGDLRLAFDDLMFRNSKLHAAVRAWESTNPPFRILPS